MMDAPQHDAHVQAFYGLPQPAWRAWWLKHAAPRFQVERFYESRWLGAGPGWSYVRAFHDREDALAFLATQAGQKVRDKLSWRTVSEGLMRVIPA